MIQIGDLKLYDVDDLVRMLSMNIQTVRKLLGEGRIPAKKFGRRWYVSEAHLVEFFQQHDNLPDEPKGSRRKAAPAPDTGA